jgi:hypothetical protein
LICKPAQRSVYWPKIYACHTPISDLASARGPDAICWRKQYVHTDSPPGSCLGLCWKVKSPNQAQGGRLDDSPRRPGHRPSLGAALSKPERYHIIRNHLPANLLCRQRASQTAGCAERLDGPTKLGAAGAKHPKRSVFRVRKRVNASLSCQALIVEGRAIS